MADVAINLFGIYDGNTKLGDIRRDMRNMTKGSKSSEEMQKIRKNFLALKCAYVFDTVVAVLLYNNNVNNDNSNFKNYYENIIKIEQSSFCQSTERFFGINQSIGAFKKRFNEFRKPLDDGMSLNEVYNIFSSHDAEQSFFDNDETKMEKFLSVFTNVNVTGTSVSHELSKVNEKENIEEKIKDLINNGVKQIIFTGAPGTGKTRIAKEIAKEMGTELSDKKYELVQFHPSYDYTDFIEGIRPSDGSNGIQFVKLDGIFMDFCRRVVHEIVNNEDFREENLYFFIIDEINRADLSKVFGELMFCLESDKRMSIANIKSIYDSGSVTDNSDDNRVRTQNNNLKTKLDETRFKKDGKVYDIFENGFFIPENVIIIGTMNDIDRSVESMDFALRRRFEWIEFIVDKEMLKSALSAMIFDDETANKDEIANKLADRIMALNEVIKNKGSIYGLNRQYYISQGQFAHIPKDKKSERLEDIIDYAWRYKIESLLREYLRGSDEKEIEEFLRNCGNALKKDAENVEEQPEDKDNS